MTVLTFLSSLPALLGVLGFVIYYLLRQNGTADEVSLKIIEKLRAQSPDRFTEHSILNAKQLHSLLADDNSLRSRISEQDFSLLQQVLKQQFITSLVVYVICSILFIVGTVLFYFQAIQPKTLVINNIQLESTATPANGLPVDLDPLIVQWNASGEETQMKVFLENIETNRRSGEFEVKSSEGSFEILPSEYRDILNNRNFNEWNRVRIVMQTDIENFISDSIKLHVGLKVVAIGFEEKVKLAAMIDNSLVQTYNFEALLVLWKNDEVDSISFGGHINGQQDYPFENSTNYSWPGAKLTYLGPDDSRLIRTEVIYD